MKINAYCPQKKVTHVFTCQTVSKEEEINRKEKVSGQLRLLVGIYQRQV